MQAISSGGYPGVPSLDTLDTVIQCIGGEEEKVVELIQFSRDHVSLDAPIEENGDTALGDLIAREPAPGPDELVLDAEERDRLEQMLSRLDARSADVVRRRYGPHDGRQAKLAGTGAAWGAPAPRYSPAHFR